MLADLFECRNFIVKLEPGLLDFPCFGAAAFAVLVLSDLRDGPRRAFGKLRPVKIDLATGAEPQIVLNIGKGDSRQFFEDAILIDRRPPRPAIHCLLNRLGDMRDAAQPRPLTARRASVEPRPNGGACRVEVDEVLFDEALLLRGQ